MGLIDEITGLMRKGPEAIGKLDSMKLNTKSVARGAKDSTFQFPCLIVDSAPIDMANTIARTLDQVYASFTQTWLSMNSMFDITIDPTPLSYLKRIHQNMKIEGVENLVVDENDMENYMEKVYDGSYRLYMNPEKTCGILFNVADHATRSMMESHKDLLSEHLSDFNLQPLEPITEADSDGTSALDLANAIVKGQVDRERMTRQLKSMDTTAKGNKAPQLLDRDVKRSNDLTPYAIQVRMIAVNDKKEFVQYVDFILGVKAILHPVQSEDMIENLARALQNKSTMFKILRWTTGELSLVKDIILNVNDMKADAINKRNGKSPFFGTLKRLKDKKVGVRNLTVPHAIIPNATIVITSYEADILQQKYAIDVTNTSVAKKLLNSLFLMAFVIMDEGTGTISILYDGDDAFQTYALETLERDNSMNSNKLGREIGRMISH